MGDFFQSKEIRRVSFASKCQIIPTSDAYEDALTEDIRKQRAAGSTVKKRHSRLGVFLRSHDAEEKGTATTNLKKSISVSNSTIPSHERKSKTLSPSLPINKNPASTTSLPTDRTLAASSSSSPSSSSTSLRSSEKLRRKLISPPPPNASISPITSLASDLSPDLPVASTSQQSFFDSGVSITKPIAVRKPLSFSAYKDLSDVDTPGVESTQKLGRDGAEEVTGLRVPAVVEVVCSPIAEEGAGPAVLNWREEGETKNDEDDDVEDDDDSEEDLNQDCVCPHCEQLMVAALSQSYSPPWTRSARKKYLADRKVEELQLSKGKSKVPSWVRGEEEEEGGKSAAVIRDIKTDEADRKGGNVVYKKREPAPTKIPTEAIDSELKKEVEQEYRQRKEDERAKQSRSEMKSLSNDSSSGLWSGGGGARAMMRQLEEADRIEKRASLQRSNSRSPATVAADIKKDSTRPMGAVKDTVVRPFTVPRRLSDHGISLVQSDATGGSTPQRDQSASPALKKKVMSPSKEELEEEKTREHRHPSPSLLMRREIALGIPVHTANVVGNRASWSGHATTRTPSPRFSHSTTLEDIAEVPSTAITEVSVSGTSTPRRGDKLGRSSSTSVRRKDGSSNGGANLKRSSTIGSKPITLGNGSGQRNNLLVNLSQHAQSSDGRPEHAKHKGGRFSLKDLVARIKH
ncbi:hypothetical protein CBS101457_002152 [Exobasidium rhododendri]|nr:hypothetical protein CBS101457_002152 [Exobasidium rhododendri]